jgi:hypothetical protein
MSERTFASFRADKFLSDCVRKLVSQKISVEYIYHCESELTFKDYPHVDFYATSKILFG